MVCCGLDSPTATVIGPGRDSVFGGIFSTWPIRSLLAERRSLALIKMRWLTSWRRARSEEHTSELQSLMRISYAVFCLKKKKQITLCYLLATFLYLLPYFSRSSL